jgi:DNA repair protein RadD
VFPAPDPGKKLAHKAAQEAVLTRDIADTWLEVTDIRYREHLGQSGVPSMRVEYQCGPLSAYSEYVCLEHTGYARERAVTWWQKRAPGTQVPRSVSSAMPVAELLPRPTHIQVRPDGKYFRIQGVRFNG